MGGYRSLKRVLGESNLERKFRWLFGISIGTLICVAFFWVWYIAKNLIDDTAQHKGRDLVRVALFNMHWRRLEKSRESKILQDELARELALEAYDARILKLDASPEPPLAGTEVFPPANEFERDVLTRL